MKIVPKSDISVAKYTTTASSCLKVCMHVLGKARTDIRAIRAATTLIAAGYEVCIYDVEGVDVQSAEEDIHGIHVQHIVASDSFMITRFDRWALIRAAHMLIRNTLRLIENP